VRIVIHHIIISSEKKVILIITERSNEVSISKNDLASFGIGIGTGLLIGGVLGILYAPKSGRETRTIIKEKAEKIAGDVRAKLNKAKISDLKA
jgi:hypothetical protein